MACHRVAASPAQFTFSLQKRLDHYRLDSQEEDNENAVNLISIYRKEAAVHYIGFRVAFKAGTSNPYQFGKTPPWIE
eukprot:6182523-Pleurochrysis_carterae.AAC.1